jgi:hypothetical protein
MDNFTAVNPVFAPGGGSGTVVLDMTKPTLGGLSFSSTVFAAARSGASTAAKKKHAKVGTKVSFNVSEASSVRFTVDRRTKGRKVHGKCKAKTHFNRTKPSCTRWKAVGAQESQAGQLPTQR